MERHGFLQVEFNNILLNVATEGYFDAAGFRVKLDNNLGVIVINHEESIFN